MMDSFAGGLGTAAFLGFFLAVCDPEQGATLQYAFLSSLFSFTGRLAGAVSGLGAERWGYGPYFALTFLASLPASASSRSSRPGSPPARRRKGETSPPAPSRPTG